MDKKKLNKVSLIWDLDGTLVDSYESIMWCLQKSLSYFGIPKNNSEIIRAIREESVQSYLNELGRNNHMDLQKLLNYYYEQIKCNEVRIFAMPNAKKVLFTAKRNNIVNFLITNRDKSTKKILKENEMEGFFESVITSESGFLRKPCPDSAIYLIDKYKLDSKFVYYIGDRLTDMIFAQNAGINGVMYNPLMLELENREQKIHIIRDLLEILDLVL